MTFRSKTSRKLSPTQSNPSPTPIVESSDLSETIAIPTAPNQPSNSLLDYSWCLYGEKGIGKSSLAAQFDDVALHEMWEPSRRDVKTPIVPQKGERPLSWPRHQEYLRKLLARRAEPGRLIIDTFDLCARACQQYHAALNGVASLNGLKDMGKGWDGMKTDWENTWAEFLWSGWRVTLLSHARVRPKIVRGIARDEMQAAVADGLVIPETQPTCPGWAYEWSKSVCAFAAYLGWQGKDRVLHIRGDERIYASSGGISEDHFLTPGKKGEPYDYIPLGRSPKQAYANLRSAWANKLDGCGFTQTETFLEPTTE